MTQGGHIKALSDEMADALGKVENLDDHSSRLKAYYEAKLDLKYFPLWAIKEADRQAKTAELSRRVSRS